ncbi:hypothetical protein lbkm_0660 [Lachnospiraceae bacterium KM106-2]|nr:hypothetical protein lbkm_0660 [Lachnospiraceae bacterium KM106-2]
MKISKNYTCDNQMDIFSFIPKSKGMIRDKCLYTDGPCNIKNTHDVANTLDDVDCKYGCCRTCKQKTLCCAACNNRYAEEKKKSFCCDKDINYIVSELNKKSNKLGITPSKTEWSIWSHVPNLGYRMEYWISREVDDSFIDIALELVDWAKEHGIELSVLNAGMGDIFISTLFTDARRNRKSDKNWKD